ncbi:MAG: molybdopterin-binding protein [Alphaproteobacteria bacterium]|nr:molybdopterin-binding protein [Alphaproteobacteria bacterium]
MASVASDSTPADSPNRTVRACLLIIGNEILSGRTKDANLAYLGHALNEIGIQLAEARVIADEPSTIVSTVNEVRETYDYVFTTGGIGPTHDDITSECVADAFGVKLLRNPEAVRRLEDHYAGSDLELNEARLRMANIPDGAELIDNPVSAAPGYRIGNVLVMAGVPRIMQAMFDGIKHTLTGGAKVLSRTVHCDLGEGNVAAGLGEIQARHAGVEIGSYPYFRSGRFGTNLVLRSQNESALDSAADDVVALVRALGGTPTLKLGEAETTE